MRVALATPRRPVFLLAILLSGCGSKHDRPDPVPECVQYQAALDACFHRDSGFATQPAMIPTTRADRAHLQQVCSENLQRIRTACR